MLAFRKVNYNPGLMVTVIHTSEAGTTKALTAYILTTESIAYWLTDVSIDTIKVTLYHENHPYKAGTLPHRYQSAIITVHTRVGNLQ